MFSGDDYRSLVRPASFPPLSADCGMRSFCFLPSASFPGISSLQRAVARGQRGSKEQPTGRSKRLGTIRDLGQPETSSAILGMDSSSPMVYGWYGARIQLLRGAFLDNTAAVHDGHLGHLGDDGKVMGDEEEDPNFFTRFSIRVSIWACTVTSRVVVGSSA